jgi:UDP-N-acetylglucosamine 2-epimerase
VTVADLYETISTAIAAASGVDIRECSYLGVPVVNIGSRQSGRDRGVNVLDVGYDRRDIARAVQQHLRNGRYPRDPLSGDGHAGPRIAQNLVEAPLHIEKKLAY